MNMRCLKAFITLIAIAYIGFKYLALDLLYIVSDEKSKQEGGSVSFCRRSSKYY